MNSTASIKRTRAGTGGSGSPDEPCQATEDRVRRRRESMITSKHEGQGDFGSADRRRSDENAAMLLDVTRVRGSDR